MDESKPGEQALDRELEAMLQAGLAALELPADPADLARWATYARLLEHWSQQINLTGHRGRIAIAQRLLLESAALAKVLPPAALIADLGSGAGIPGIPIALARPDTRVILVDSRRRRNHFQRAVLRALDLERVDARLGRVEDLEPTACDGVICQAFSAAPQALEWMLPWSRPGGWVGIATNPGAAPRELPDRVRDPREVRYRASGGPERALWVATRC